MRLKISNGRIIDPANKLDQTEDLYIEAGHVVGIGKSPKGFKVEQEIDASNQIVCPGLVDLCARLREPGQEHKATIASETAQVISLKTQVRTQSSFYDSHSETIELGCRAFSTRSYPLRLTILMFCCPTQVSSETIVSRFAFVNLKGRQRVLPAFCNTSFLVWTKQA